MSSSCLLAAVFGLLCLFGFSAYVECQVDSSSSATAASWANVAAGIDAYPYVDNLLFVVGNVSGIQYSHSKGSLAPSLSTMLSVASASKIVTATVIFKLIEQGFLSLSDSPQKYLSWWTNDPNDERSEVTLQQLLAFTSGFAADNSCLGSTSYTLTTCAQQIYNQSFLYTPGTTFYYSGNHLQIVGAIAEAATNTSWVTLFYKYLGTPLNLATNILYTPVVNPRLAGGLYISSTDYVTFIQTYLSGSLLSPSSYALMLTDNTPSPQVNMGYSPVANGSGQSWHYCQGNWLECELPVFNSSCTAKKVHSSPGAYGYYPRIDFVNQFYSIVIHEGFATYAYVASVIMFQQVESNVTALMMNNALNSPSTPATNPPTTAAATAVASSTTTLTAKSSAAHNGMSALFGFAVLEVCVCSMMTFIAFQWTSFV